MSNDDDFQDDDQQDDPNIRRLREKAKRADTLESDNANLAKELAVYRAGISGLNERQVKALIASVDGEFNEEAVKQAATDLGFVKADESETVPAAELAAMQATTDASVGAPPPNSGDAETRFKQAMDSANTEDEWRAAMDELGPEMQFRRT